ncbi:hypothetical protein [Flavobacterium pectinovorum]|uniref:hypothetical protein n=1 Tax=Flavobacterium pectinovorum TaxID=29533 RepID=UPI001FAC7974|nr:hypothetical protein [Flavobacterium pectinovorum]MCI9846913.1 hypothetical protein [Flavobacterium pectinovorum]
MKNYVYIEKASSIKFIIGNLLFILSFFIIISINKSNAPILLLVSLLTTYWGIFFISSEGLEIDFQNKKFRKLFAVYGFRISLTWTFFPEIQYIALVETTVKQTFGGRGFKSSATTTITEKTIKINVFDCNEKYFTLYFANDRNSALEIASKIEDAFKIEVLTNF